MGHTGALKVNWAAVTAVAGVVAAVAALLVFVVPPAGDGGTTAGPSPSASGSGPVATTPPTNSPAAEPSPTKAPDPIPPPSPLPQETITINDRSYYSDDFYAKISTVDLDRTHNLAVVNFEAVGGPGLRDPRSSCLSVPGYRDVPVLRANLSTDTAGHFVGSLTFALIDAGHYSFTYSCQSDYTAVPLFSFP